MQTMQLRRSKVVVFAEHNTCFLRNTFLNTSSKLCMIINTTFPQIETRDHVIKVSQTFPLPTRPLPHDRPQRMSFAHVRGRSLEKTHKKEKCKESKRFTHSLSTPSTHIIFINIKVCVVAVPAYTCTTF